MTGGANARQGQGDITPVPCRCPATNGNYHALRKSGRSLTVDALAHLLQLVPVTNGGTMEGLRLKPLMPGLAGLVLFVLVAAYGYHVLKTVVADTEARKHARETLLQAEWVLSLLKDVETGQRGYLLTGDRTFLGPYQDASARLDSALATLRRGLEDNRVDGGRFRAVEQLVARRVAIAADNLALRQTTALPAMPSGARARLEEGKRVMDSLRTEFQALELELRQRLRDLDRQVQARQARARWVAYGVAGVAGALLLLAYGLLLREQGRRVRSEQALAHAAGELARRRGAELESVFQALPDLYFRLAPDGTILDYRGRRDQLYVPPETFLGQAMPSLLPPSVGALFAAKLAEAPGADGLVSFEYALPMPEGERQFEARLARLPDTAQRALVVRDITARKRDEAALRQARNDLRAFARKLDRDIETERQRLAREVHDQLGQIFTALKLKLLGYRPGGALGPATVEEVEVLLDEGIRVARRISADLRPAMLDDLGLGPALEQHARQFAEGAGLAVEVAVMPDARLTPVQANLMFRIVQEALTNVVRHAGAHRVRIRGGADDGHYALSVEDDGKGLLATYKEGLGMLGMRERAALMGASLSLEASELGGLGVRVRLALIEEER